MRRSFSRGGNAAARIWGNRGIPATARRIQHSNLHSAVARLSRGYGSAMSRQLSQVSRRRRRSPVSRSRHFLHIQRTMVSSAMDNENGNNKICRVSNHSIRIVINLPNNKEKQQQEAAVKACHKSTAFHRLEKEN